MTLALELKSLMAPDTNFSQYLSDIEPVHTGYLFGVCVGAVR